MKGINGEPCRLCITGLFWPSPAGASLLLVIPIIYTLTLLGNTTISYLNSRLHTSIYFFLSNFSFLDLCFTTNIVPQMLWNLNGPEKTMSYTGYVIQVLGLGTIECVLLSVMVHDCYNAICHPFHMVLSCTQSSSSDTSGLGLDQWFSGVHHADQPFFTCTSATTRWTILCVKPLPWFKSPVRTQPSWKMNLL